MRVCRIAVIILVLVVNAFAQDPLKTLPQAYKLQFENEWVKVVRVHYAPHEKLPAHEHTPMASAYVYLTDGGPVVFNHVDKDYGAVTRPATKAGSFRVYRGIQEHHTVENKSDLASDFLRVEFKTDPVDEKTLRGKFFREEYPAGENFQKVQFENVQIRITRMACAPRNKLDVDTSSGRPALVIALSSAQMKVSQSKGGSKKVKLDLGQSRWIDGNHQEQFTNADAAPVELLRFDFKTNPLSKEAIEQKKKHDHPKNGV